MARPFAPRDLAAETTTDMVGALGALLHRTGHRELAALLGGVFDPCEVHHRRGGEPGFLAPLARQDDPVLTYVIDQLGQLADVLEASGEPDRAALLRLPALLLAHNAGAATDRFRPPQSRAAANGR